MPRTDKKTAPPLTLPVREAKNQFSSILRRVARGEEVIITSYGEPRARLCPVEATTKPFVVDWKWLREMKVKEPMSRAEELIRSDRDGRD